MLSLLGGLHCTSSEPGVSVDFGVNHHLGNDVAFEGVRHGAGDARALSNTAGYDIVLHKAYVVMTEFELVPCADTPLQTAARVLFGPSVARAHSGGSARVLGVPHVLDLMDEDGALLAHAIMQPPPDTYCEARVTVAPADHDAEGLPQDTDMVGSSLYLAGSFVAPAAGRSVDFELRTDLTRDTRLEFQRVSQGAGGVELSEPGTVQSLRLEVHYGALFEDIELGEQGLAEQAYYAVTNLLGNMAVVVCDGDGDCDAP